MSVKELKTNNQPFPSNKNVRIAVSGLAINELDRDVSIIRFLRHVPHHKLKLTITVRHSNGNLIEQTPPIILEPEHNVSISGSDSVMPQSYIYQHREGIEFPLSEMINLWDLHGHELEFKTNLPDPPPSLLVLKHCSFYTAKLTEYQFDLLKNGQLIKNQSKFGEILGAYMQCNSGTLDIIVEGHSDFPKHLPIFDANGSPFLYDISFDNHCEDEEACENLLGEGQTDFHFLYDVVGDDNPPEDLFAIVKPFGLSRLAASPVGTGACLNGTKKPPRNG
jgi:hypothetical protein